MWIKILGVLCIIISCKGDDSEWLEVKTQQGIVRGRKDPEGGLYVFYNIPYATAPVGPDRYKAPLPPPVWLEPFEAVDKRVICPQTVNPSIEVESRNMQENCLIANVYVPDTKDKNLPVIVIVHGGGFGIGYGENVSPKHLVREKKVIVVNFNYRLGVHGFLCLGTQEAPGNAGMKDQVALLRWVNKHIASYGGNPDDVTLAGGSAGSISVDFLSLSEIEKGLFHKIVPESGVSTSYISVQGDPIQNARQYAKWLNFTDTDDFTALQNFYLKTPLDSLITFFVKKDFSLLFTPCVERKAEQAFLTDTPVNILKSGKFLKMPLLIGYTNMEGLMYAGRLDKVKADMNENFSNYLPTDLEFNNEEEKREVGDKVKQFYFGEKPVGEETIINYIDYLTDIVFKYPTARNIKLRKEAGHEQIYLYEYSFVDESFHVVPHTNIRGAGHCAQTKAVLDGSSSNNPDESSLSKEYKQMKAVMRELWHNFYVQGKPVPEGSSLSPWPAVTTDGSPYMSLKLPLELRKNFRKERMDFWDNIYDKYYKQPVPASPPTSGTAHLHGGLMLFVYNVLFFILFL